jgi:hypothetical protein
VNVESVREGMKSFGSKLVDESIRRTTEAMDGRLRSEENRTWRDKEIKCHHRVRHQYDSAWARRTRSGTGQLSILPNLNSSNLSWILVKILGRQSFSMATYKRLALNGHLLERFISMLGLDPTLIKSHPNYDSLLQYGSLAP